jgi:hypothetical protein
MITVSSKKRVCFHTIVLQSQLSIMLTKAQYLIKVEQLLLAVGMGLLAYRVYVLEERVHELRVLCSRTYSVPPKPPVELEDDEERIAELVEDEDSSDDETLLEQQPASPPKEVARSKFVTTRQESVSEES